MKLLEEIIFELSKLSEDQLTNENLHQIKKNITKKYNVTALPTNIQLQKKYQELVNLWKIKENKALKFLLMKRKVRSLSGIVPIQVLTKPWPCPGKCIFCPDEARMPKSYISSEPWAQRALLNDFDPIKQVYNRLLSLQSSGHNTDKIEMIVLWWSFDAYPYEYKLDFIKKLYDACNTFEDVKSKLSLSSEHPKSARFTIDLDKLDIKLSSSLEEAQKINENAKNRIIWLTIETRPDLVTEENVRFWRKLGVTRLEIWVQSVFNDVLQANKRWHTIEDVKKALHLVRKYWLKISVHMMPWLYKSNPEKDIESFKILFEDPYLKPDELKFYPTSVIPNTELYDLWKKWDYKPITTEEIKYIVKKVKQNYIPPYTRIKRLIRDIPSQEIASWSKITNLRQLINQELLEEKDLLNDKYFMRLFCDNDYKVSIFKFTPNQEDLLKNPVDISTVRKYFHNNFVCLCTRCREIRNKTSALQMDNDMSILLVIRKYNSSVWEEYFISFETLEGYLIWFVRLLLPKDFANWEWLGENVALIRELHVYGLEQKIGKAEEWVQHRGFWKKLMYVAEQIAFKNWYKKISVISGVGVRWFYRKIGYNLEWTYMVKNLA